MLKLLVYLSIVITLVSCDSQKKEAERLRTDVDSLKRALTASARTAETLQEIGTLIDSIDINRHVLRTRMIEGTTMSDFTYRMKEINNYVKETEKRVSFLESRLHDSKFSNSSFSSMLKKLKHDLENRNQEIAALQKQVDQFHNEKENLVMTVNLQKEEIADKIAQLEAKQQEVVKLDASIKQLLAQSKIDEAESYFARAQALEETARRTKFAPRKKRNTRMEAIELYKLAYALGKEDAQERVVALEKKI